MIDITSALLIALSLIYGGIAIYQDIKKREVSNWVNFSFIALLFFVLLFESIIKLEFYPILICLIALGIYFGMANLFYYGRIFAGGDAKLLMGLGIAVSSISITALNFPAFFNTLLSFMANILYLGSIYGLGYSLVLYLTYKDKKRIKRLSEEIKNKNKKIYTTALIFSLIFIALSILLKNIYFFVLAILIFISSKLLISLKVIENCCLVKAIPVSQLREGDWLSIPFKIKGKKEIIPTWDGLTNKDIERLKKYEKGKKILIKEGLPFTPVIVSAFIVYLIWGNLLYLIVLLMA